MSYVTPTLRITDAEREPVIERLKVAYVEGRLPVSEFESRLNRALTVETRGQLAAVTADLTPPTEARRAAPEPPTGRQRLVAAGAHASGMIPLLPLPLLLVVMVATRSTWVRRQVVEALNFQLSVLMAVILTLGIGAVLYAVVWMVVLVGAAFALAGQDVRYPLIVRPFK